MEIFYLTYIGRRAGQANKHSKQLPIQMNNALSGMSSVFYVSKIGATNKGSSKYTRMMCSNFIQWNSYK